MRVYMDIQFLYVHLNMGIWELIALWGSSPWSLLSVMCIVEEGGARNAMLLGIVAHFWSLKSCCG